MTDEARDARDILAANEAFYEAFAAGDLAAMDRVWSPREEVGCIHPGWQPLRSRAAVMGSWDAIFRGPSRVRVSPTEPAVTLLGGGVAYVVCRERIAAPTGAVLGSLVATNVFVQEQGSWRMVHHHGSAVAREPEDTDETPREPGAGRTLN